MLGLHCCMGFSLVVASKGYPLVGVRGLPIVVTAFVEGHRREGMWTSAVGSVVAAPRL